MNLRDEATLCGILTGDGCLCLYKPKNSGPKYTIDITVDIYNDQEFCNNIILPLLKRFTDKKVRAKLRLKEGKIEIVLYSKKLFYYIHKEWNFPIGKKGNIKISKKFLSDKTLLKRVIAGLFATDGSVIFSKQHRSHPYYPRFEFSSSSSNLLNQLYVFFKNDEYKVSKSKDKVSINGFESTRKFIKEIGVINTKHYKKYINKGR